MIVISVGRDGKELGDFDLAKIEEGLASRYFLFSDWGWYAGLPEWITLAEVVTKLKTPPPPPMINAQVPEPRIMPGPKSKAQHLSVDKDGKVAYVLHDHPHRGERFIDPWDHEPASDRQISFLYSLGVVSIPPHLTKGAASNLIDERLSQGYGGHPYLSAKQVACLHYFGFEPAQMGFDQAKAILDKVHQHPGSFQVPEPWETAKYRLYPNLYPPETGMAS